MEQPYIGFYGGVGNVTGANFLLYTGFESVLVDCGLVQGGDFASSENSKAFSYDPKTISTLFVTHAHADHIGRIPKLVKDGFRGAIVSTPPTKELSAIMLFDAYRVMCDDARTKGTPILYEEKDIDAALRLWETRSYHEVYTCKGGVEMTFSDAGHILGSAFITFVYRGTRVFFSGDVGNIPQPLLNPPEYPTDIAYMVLESVYGDRRHEDVENRTLLLRAHIERTYKKGGTLIIPAFSLERTQAMLVEINTLVESGAIPPIPTFLDSPLAILVTDIYRKYTSYLSTALQERIRAGDDIFNFPKLVLSHTAKDSAHIHTIKGPKIIIAGSGMSHGGRIRTHEREYLDDTHTTVLLVGYQTVGSIGRLLQDGAQHVTIDGERVAVRARIETIRGYSGHADRDQLLDLVAHTAPTLKHVCVAMGEEKASLFLVQRIRDYLTVDASAPKEGMKIPIVW